MLGAYYHLFIQNNCGESINASNVTARFRKWKFNSSGALVLSSSTTVSGDNTTLGDGLYDDLGSAINNTSDLYLGLVGTLECNLSSGTPDGTVDCYLKISSDGTNYSDDDLQPNVLIASCVFDGTAEDNHAPLSYG